MTNTQSLPATSVWSRILKRFGALRRGSKIRARRLSSLGKVFKSSKRRKAEKELEARMAQEEEWANDNKQVVEDEHVDEEDDVKSDNGEVFASNSIIIPGVEEVPTEEIPSKVHEDDQPSSIERPVDASNVQVQCDIELDGSLVIEQTPISQVVVADPVIAAATSTEEEVTPIATITTTTIDAAAPEVETSTATTVVQEPEPEPKVIVVDVPDIMSVTATRIDETKLVVASEAPNPEVSQCQRNEFMDHKVSSVGSKLGNVSGLRQRFESAAAAAAAAATKDVCAKPTTSLFTKSTKSTLNDFLVKKQEDIKQEQTALVQEQQPVVAVVQEPSPTIAVVDAPVVDAPVVIEVPTIIVEKDVQVVEPVAKPTTMPTHLLSAAEIQTGMLAIAAKPYKEQAIWFMNAFWTPLFKSSDTNAEKVWTFTAKFIELDTGKGAQGCEIDELRAHRILELLDSALTHTDLRSKFHVRAKHISLIEMLLFVFSSDAEACVTAPQSSDGALEQLKQAEALLESAKASVEQSRDTAKRASEDEKQAHDTAIAASKSKEEAISRENQSVEQERVAIEAEAKAEKERLNAVAAATESAACLKQCEDAEIAASQTAATSESSEQNALLATQRAAEAEKCARDNEVEAQRVEGEAFRRETMARDAEMQAVDAEKAQAEAKARCDAALEKVKAEEAAFNKILNDLRAKSSDESISLVARRTSAHELAMILNKDPEPLAVAKISEEAVVRRHEKALHVAVAARVAAVTCRTASETAREEAIKSRQTAEEASVQASVHKSAAETKHAVAMAAAEEARKAADLASTRRKEADASKEQAVSALLVAEQARQDALQARVEAAEALQASTQARLAAEMDETKAVQSKESAQKSRMEADQAVVDAVGAFERAHRFVERTKQQASSGQGAWWWASRQVKEAKRFVPQRLQSQMDFSLQGVTE